MDSELFEREWQRVAVDAAAPTYDQLQELLFHVTKCQVWAANRETRCGPIPLELDKRFIERCHNLLWLNRTDW